MTAWFGPTLDSTDIVDEDMEWPAGWASSWWSEDDTGVEMAAGGGATSGVERARSR